MENKEQIKIGNQIANPAPLGLMGFGMTTILLNLANAGFFPLDSVVMAMGIFYGGIAQIIAGIMEFKKNNTFGATAFTSYGAFWLSLVAIIWLPKAGFVAGPALAMGWFLTLWGFFTLYMFIATLKHNCALRFVFFSLTVLFALLAAGEFVGCPGITRLAGWVGIVCGASAIYAAMAQVINETFQRNILPL